MKSLLVIDTTAISSAFTKPNQTYWSVVSLNCISVPSGAVFVCEGIKIGPRGGSKSVDLGGGSLYRIGAGAASFFLLFCDVLAFGSGVALALVSGARDPAFDSRFFRDSFFALGARSRARAAASSCGFEGLKSGFSGEETAGWWSSSRARFGGIEVIGGVIVGVASR